MTGVELADGVRVDADIVVSNVDAPTTDSTLIDCARLHDRLARTARRRG